MIVDVWSVLIRTVFIYFLVLFLMRVMGKREVGKLSIFDLIVSFMIADLASMALETEKGIIEIVFPMAILVTLQIGLSYLTLKNKTLRNVFDGEPTVIVNKGKIQDQTMKKLRYNLDDLMMQLREKNIYDVADVEFAILETSGKLSVLPKEARQPVRMKDLFAKDQIKEVRLPIPVIVDGKVQDEGLAEINQNRFWLKREIQKYGYKDFKEIYFACVGSEGELYLDRKDY